ncbi:MAG: o-succinylbenzoate synthase [Bacteroidota bacterium]
MKISYKKHVLEFNFPAGTSRGVMESHTVYYVKIEDSTDSKHFGLGECAPLQGLSIDFLPNFEDILAKICQQLSAITNLDFSTLYELIPESLPSIRFGLETALLDYKNGGNRILFSNDFSTKNQPIEINGLIWMGDKGKMLQRIEEKINQGYKTLKLKVGAIDFQEECFLLERIRNSFSEADLCIRLDANGAFPPSEALKKIEILSKFGIHSIEQPIAAHQKLVMRDLIQKTSIPIALDEELIGIFGNDRQELLEFLQPPFIILKPTLLGGFESTKKWIHLAENHEIEWWITSALESNIGLNAIAQFAGDYMINLPQGLGTGQLYSNNVGSPLKIENGKLYYDQNSNWDLAFTS